MDITGILRRTWEITWRHKGLWVLGILANCSGGQGGSNASRLTEIQSPRDEFPQLERWVATIPEETWLAIGLAVLCLVLLLALLFWVLAAIGNGGIIAAFQMAETGEAVSLGSAFQKGLAYLWRLLLLQIVLALATFLILGPTILGGILFSILTAGVGLICLIPLLCLLFPLGIALSLYAQLAQVALVVDDLDLPGAFLRGWAVLRARPGEVLIMALLLGVGGFVIGLILAVPFILLAIPLILSLLAGTDASGLAGLSVSLIGILLYLPILLVASGVLRTFTTGAWTLTYRSLTGAQAA